MDSSIFDQLIRLFAASPTRRGLGSVLLGSVAASLGLDDAVAAPCPKSKKPCRGKCIPKSQCCTNASCQPGRTGKVCRNGRCVCPAARPRTCRGRCIPRSGCCTTAECAQRFPNATGVCQNTSCVFTGCQAGFANCDGNPATGCEASLSAAGTCGSCTNACDGIGSPHATAVCADPATGTCQLTCAGEHYDVDGEPGNGCEIADTPTGNHTQADAVLLGSFGCNIAVVRQFGGAIPSDNRDHVPAFPGFNRSTGSAPDWFRIDAQGGAGCAGVVVAQFSTLGGGPQVCYRLTVLTNLGSASGDISGNNAAGVQVGPVQHSPNTPISVRVEKVCSASAVQERVQYGVSYALV